MEWNERDFKVIKKRTGWSHLLFRGRLVDKGEKHILVDYIARLANGDAINSILAVRLIAIDALWGSCLQCGKPFKRNMRGRPRKFHKRGCANLWHTHKHREARRVAKEKGDS